MTVFGFDTMFVAISCDFVSVNCVIGNVALFNIVSIVSGSCDLDASNFDISESSVFILVSLLLSLYYYQFELFHSCLWYYSLLLLYNL